MCRYNTCCVHAQACRLDNNNELVEATISQLRIVDELLARPIKSSTVMDKMKSYRRSGFLGGSVMYMRQMSVESAKNYLTKKKASEEALGYPFLEAPKSKTGEPVVLWAAGDGAHRTTALIKLAQAQDKEYTSDTLVRFIGLREETPTALVKGYTMAMNQSQLVAAGASFTDMVVYIHGVASNLREQRALEATAKKGKRLRPITADDLFVFLSQAKSLAGPVQEDQRDKSLRDPYTKKHLKTFVKFIDNVGMDGVEALVAMQELDAQSCYQYYRSREATYRGGKHVVKPEPDWGAKSFLPLPWAHHYTPSTNFTKVMPKLKVLASLMRAWAQWIARGAVPAPKAWWLVNMPNTTDDINKVLDNATADIALIRTLYDQMLAETSVDKQDAMMSYQTAIFLACLGGTHRIELARMIRLCHWTSG